MQLQAFVPMYNTADVMTFGERWIASAKVILTGFLVVFSVLLLLIGIIKLYSALVGKAQSKNLKTKNFRDKKAADEPKEAVKSAAVENTAAAADPDEIPGEVIAVISAAVAVMYGGKDKVRIKSVKRSSHTRSAWANAGVIENTRPF